MNKKSNFFIILLIICFGFLSCSKYNKLLKSANNEAKYNTAIKYYEANDYYRALQLFDQLLPVYRGTDKAEKMSYYYSYCYFKQEQYTMAAYHFNNFYQTFPKNDKAEECAYMSAFSKYLDSPLTSLDQTNTIEAIKEFQLFINLFPNSERISVCNDLMDKLRFKLENKDFDNAKLYYNTEDYTAAVTSFNTILKDYPDTKFKEQILYYIVKSYYEFAINSIESKKPDRFKKTITAYNNLLLNYPQSNYLKDCSSIFKNSVKMINKFNNQNTNNL